jgi:translation initiation factor 2 subunit 2
MNYDELLNSAYEKIKPLKNSGERFETPKVQGHSEGTKTIITNLSQIASYIRRDQEHLLKFLLKELATSGKIKGNQVVLQRRIPSLKINEKIEQYINEFVLCRECKKPDTEIIKDKGFAFINCLACGAKHSVRAKL